MNIYVGNLSYQCSDDELRGLFEPYGEVVNAQVIVDRMTNRSKGFGFVEMGDADQAGAAIEAINGMNFMGRPVTANEARPREERPRREFRPRNGGGGGGYGGGGNGGGGGRYNRRDDY